MVQEVRVKVAVVGEQGQQVAVHDCFLLVISQLQPPNFLSTKDHNHILLIDGHDLQLQGSDYELID